jgi:phosphatidylethanolamine/phosphatidyl-N-methylethanolamine N-methyltransferase
MLSLARRALKPNIRVVHMNGEALAFENDSFDYVVLSHVIAVVECPEKVIEEAYRVLKPKGKVFILNHFTPDNGLKYMDKAFGKMARLFHFNAVFPLSGLGSLKKFTLLHACNAGLFSYFKIRIYEKNV